MIVVAKNISLVETRCYECGRFWAHEDCSKNVTCPFCARDSVAMANARADKAERSARSVKAAAHRKVKS